VNLPFLRGLSSYLISLTSLTKFGSRRGSLLLGEAIDANCGPVAAIPTAVNPTALLLADHRSPFCGVLHTYISDSTTSLARKRKTSQLPSSGTANPWYW
jgi:hypothetical protein